MSFIYRNLLWDLILLCGVHSDYLRKISLKMLATETRSQNPMPDGRCYAGKLRLILVFCAVSFSKFSSHATSEQSRATASYSSSFQSCSITTTEIQNFLHIEK